MPTKYFKYNLKGYFVLEDEYIIDKASSDAILSIIINIY